MTYYVIYRAKTGDMREIKKTSYGSAMWRYRKLIKRGYTDVTVQKGKSQ